RDFHVTGVQTCALPIYIPDDPTTTPPNRYEEGEGLGTGLIVAFDIYNNDPIFGVSNPSEATPAPSIDVFYGGQRVASKPFPVSRSEERRVGKECRCGGW